MNEPEVRIVDQADRARAASVQVAAFAADPIMRWMWPQAHDYLQHFPTLVSGFGGGAFGNDTAHTAADFSGGSLWLPPGVAPDNEALEKLFKDSVAEPRQSAMFRILEQMDEAHPHEPHWHLAVIGVDAAHQGRGIGAALMQFALARIDEQGLPAYLESSNLRNVPFYQRHGFEVIREISVGGSPVVTPMLRAAQ